MGTGHEELHTDSLLAKISGLEARIEQLTLKLEEVARQQIDWDRLDTERVKLIELELMDAFERIKNIEFKFFPNLARDIVRLSEIIGPCEEQVSNPLDYRSR